MALAHEKLDVYRLSLEVAGTALLHYDSLDGKNRSLRDQLLRASQSISVNIAEGNGKWNPAERARFFQIARGSALECAAAFDLLAISEALPLETIAGSKESIERIVGMLTKLIASQRSRAREEAEPYGLDARDRDHDRDHDHDL